MVPLTGDRPNCFASTWQRTREAGEPNGPLFPGMTLAAVKPTGIAAVKAQDSETRNPRATEAAKHWRTVADRQAKTLSNLTVAEAQSRLILDWSAPLSHMTIYKRVFRPAVQRANRLFPSAGVNAGLVFHSLRHTYVSLCVAAGIKPLDISRFAGHSKVTTTLNIYAHLFEDDHSDAMAALGAMSTPTALEGDSVGNVVTLRPR